MDLILNHNIDLDYFNGESLKYKKYLNINEIKKEEYGNFLELDKVKNKLEKLNPYLESIRRAAAKYNHEYELVKVLCKKNVISRSYFKLYEMLYNQDILNNTKLNCVFLCEAPGGFIDAILDMRRKNNLTIDYLCVSKKDSTINFNKYINKESIIYADILNINKINSIIQQTKKKFTSGVEIVTADGGFDIKKYNSQEIFIFPLLLAEVIIGLSIQKENGTFIIKFFDMFTHNTIVLYLILCSFYKEVKIIKPLTSRNSNSERYLVCKGFIKNTDKHTSLLNKLSVIFSKIFISESLYTILFPNFNFEKMDSLKNISILNNKISKNQIIAINNSLDMVNSKDSYIIRLLINIFTGNFKMSNLYKYNIILNSKIKLCIEWLKKYSITTVNVNY
jgi:23S rRNA U2552 (ribose-2'-O)-methylase RlmE/FtsJ